MYFSKAGTTLEGIPPNLSHTIWNLNRGKASATTKCTPPNHSHTVRNLYRGEAGAATEGFPPITVTLSGISIVVRFAQSKKAELPIFFTPYEISTEVRIEQP